VCFAAAPLGPLLAAKTAVGSAAAPGQIGYIHMVDGERRLPNAIDVAQASGASTAQAAEAALLVPSAPNWVNVAQLDGAHSGDAVNVLIDSHSSVHLAQIHVDWCNRRADVDGHCR
jgi:hypothetical protein